MYIFLFVKELKYYNDDEDKVISKVFRLQITNNMSIDYLKKEMRILTSKYSRYLAKVHIGLDNYKIIKNSILHDCYNSIPTDNLLKSFFEKFEIPLDDDCPIQKFVNNIVSFDKNITKRAIFEEIHEAYLSDGNYYNFLQNNDVTKFLATISDNYSNDCGVKLTDKYVNISHISHEHGCKKTGFRL